MRKGALEQPRARRRTCARVAVRPSAQVELNIACFMIMSTLGKESEAADRKVARAARQAKAAAKKRTEEDKRLLAKAVQWEKAGWPHAGPLDVSTHVMSRVIICAFKEHKAKKQSERARLKKQRADLKERDDDEVWGVRKPPLLIAHAKSCFG